MVVEVITSEEHFKKIINGDKDKAIFIDFWAPWCGPCRAISPTVDKLAELEAAANVGFYKLNIDDVESVAQEYGISSIPTFIYFKGGKKVEEVKGARREVVVGLASKAAGTELKLPA